MRILIIGQTSLHWGRMEFGNIGNYYVMEPFFKEINRVFPSSEIHTTIQMSDEFCTTYQIHKLPLELYYSWDDDLFLEKTLAEYSSALLYNKTGKLIKSTPYIEEVLNSDLVIDMSGDVWGDNADFAGKNRFLIGLLKDRVAQLMNKKVVMIAGSPGPFNSHLDLHPFTKEVFEGFDLVTNRESVSVNILSENGFNVSKVKSFTCPAFLFEKDDDKEIENIVIKEKIKVDNQKTVGFIICGWNMLEGPYGKWPRKDEEYSQFIEVIEYMVNELKLNVVLFSHNNGFELPPNFSLIHGRDFPIANQLFNLLQKRGQIDKDRVHLIKSIYSPKQMKALISNFDMLVSGRVHGSVAALSEFVPTVMIDYGHEPKAHKIRGFAKVAGVEEYLTDPSDVNDMKSKINSCWTNRSKVKKHLLKQIPIVKELARKNFDELITILGEE